MKDWEKMAKGMAKVADDLKTEIETTKAFLSGFMHCPLCARVWTENPPAGRRYGCGCQPQGFQLAAWVNRCVAVLLAEKARQ